MNETHDRQSRDRAPAASALPTPAAAASSRQPGTATLERGASARSRRGSAAARAGDAPSGAIAGDVTQARVMRSEWTKLRSLRSTQWTMGLAVLLLIGLALPLCVSASENWTVADVQAGSQDPVYQSLAGLLLAQVAVGVLGVLTMTGEYATGMIRATLGLVPRRLPVLWAKAAVLAGVTFVAMLVASLVSFLIGQAILGSHDVGVSLSSDGAARAILGAAFYLTAIALLGLTLGALIRHTAGAVTALLGAVLGLPLIFSMFGERLESAQRYLPALLGNAISSTSPARLTDLVSPGRAFVMLCLYIAVLGAASAYVLTRRDV
ncbi:MULTISPECIES: ABC transporter permease subunit [unclassified Pseudofrankia]|uniref:ABC transporter permease subunit n=1 Tax=unclassified Pseudofrankia TaxID=2994372 RepID=UPI0009F24C8F|nr:MULTISPECIES: ABC transporter permease subunit [unclassified Pseudofrankia]MDT3441741.1 ABC transporter permease subunit [Pseudofrankia sp. BMG5.37]